MDRWNQVGIEFANYKAFGPEYQRVDRIAPLNIVIGRNNSGKSALLEAISHYVSPDDVTARGHRGAAPDFHVLLPIEAEAVEFAFKKGTTGGGIRGDHFQFGRQFINVPAVFSLVGKKQLNYISSDPEVPDRFRQSLTNKIVNPFGKYQFRRIGAERDVLPEGADDSLTLQASGAGMTNLIQHFLNFSTADQHKVERDILGALNDVFAPDSDFTRIQTKRSPTGHWEIYLEEESKGAIPLSESGSGLKTVLLVLACLFLVPEIEGRRLSEYIFTFEEVENGLHPGLQRRLFSYLRRIAVDSQVTFFISTHSNVVIDLFSTDPEAQLIHVTHNKTEASLKVLTDYSHHTGLLDDLDVRASDLLQSNGIIWVEGPSDRIYINRYIELLSDGRLREGAHYQCVFYGGKLLRRLSADTEEVRAVRILKVNRHAALVLDKDTRRLNDTKRRMIAEVESAGGPAIVTKGKEIESDVPLDAYKALWRDPSLEAFGPLESFSSWVARVKPKLGTPNKIEFAELLVEHITKDMVVADGVLHKKLMQLVDAIDSWNLKS